MAVYNPQPSELPPMVDDNEILLLRKITALLYQSLGSGEDIEIGAVELKDGTTDSRAKVGVLSGLLASDSGQAVTDPLVNAILGTTTGAGVITDANGTIQQYLRGLVTRWANALGAGTAAAALRATLASDDPAVTVLGLATDAAVTTDATGSIHAYLRGLIKQWIAGTLVIGAGANLIGKVGLDQTTPGTTDRVTTGGLITATSTVVMSVAGSYATGDYIGTTTTPQAFTSVVRSSGFSGIIKSLRISDKNTTAAVAMELWVFSVTFVAPTDNAAWAISDAEAFTCLGVIPISTARWYASSNNKIYTDDTVSLVITPGATSLFYALVARGTTPSWTSGDLDICIGIAQQ